MVKWWALLNLQRVAIWMMMIIWEIFIYILCKKEKRKNILQLDQLAQISCKLTCYLKILLVAYESVVAQVEVTWCHISTGVVFTWLKCNNFPWNMTSQCVIHMTRCNIYRWFRYDFHILTWLFVTWHVEVYMVTSMHK